VQGREEGWSLALWIMQFFSLRIKDIGGRDLATSDNAKISPKNLLK
jgi:hypothetical protein